MRFLLSLIMFACVHRGLDADIVIDFEELNTFNGSNTAGGGMFYNGGNVTNSNGWSSKGVQFNNNYNSAFGGFWDGWSYSNVNNSAGAGFDNQYASFPGGGDAGSQKYAVAFGTGAFFNLPDLTKLASVSLANTTYAGLSMRDGDFFAKKFGGVSGNDPDFFRVKLIGRSGLNGTGAEVGQVTVNLADFTFADNTQDFILGSWLNVDLTSIADSKSVSLEFESSDVGGFGINTPTYLAFDNLRLTAVPEPTSMACVGLTLVGLAARRFRKKQSAV